jgi:hypothetical protein
MIAWSDTACEFHGAASNCGCCTYIMVPPPASTLPEPDEDVKKRLLEEHRAECQQAFRKPPKLQGRGDPPRKRWEARRPPPRNRGRGRRRGRR